MSKGTTIQSPGGGGGWAGVFVTDKLFISTRLGGALKISNFIECQYRTLLDVNNLFLAQAARNYLFKKTPPPPPLEIEWLPPNYLLVLF